MAARRAAHETYPGQWEFPGGKIEEGESPGQALIRELKEELGIDVSGGVSLGAIVHSYEEFDVELEVFLVIWTGQEISLTEHSEICWVPADHLGAVGLAPADRPFIERIRRHLASSIDKE